MIESTQPRPGWQITYIYDKIEGLRERNNFAIKVEKPFNLKLMTILKLQRHIPTLQHITDFCSANY